MLLCRYAAEWRLIMKINDIIHGFCVYDSVCSPELGGTMWKLRHIKTGGELVWLDNQEENKLFAICFKTVPTDDTGVFHILEHSVLCGSQNYPVKEPFLDLLKGSMNTFLNAFTFPDKTMYPVSSRNEQDFINLTGVYLDAVFCPAIYSNRHIFEQEGWHYQLEDKDGTPSYNGVVFNEMKGCYSSVENVIDTELCAMLYPDSCYRFSSGGDPKAIPDLTYEQFIETHEEFYHPSNSRTYLDGSIPLERTLALIDGYFAGYGKIDAEHPIPLQSPVPATEKTAYYEIGKDDDTANKAHMAFGKLLCSWEDRKKAYAAQLLATYLCGTNASPLKREILERGLAQDAWIAVYTGTAQVLSMLRIRNTEIDNSGKIKATVKEIAEGLIKSGLPRDELAAAINHMEFSLKELDEPRGIERAILSMNAWLYGGKPEEYLLNDDVIASLRAALDTDYYEKLLAELLLDDAHTASLYVLPSKNEGERIRKLESERLCRESQAWNESDRQAIIRLNAELTEWQTAQDSPEALAALPTLSVCDIDRLPSTVPTEFSVNGDVEMIYHKLPTNGVVHASLYFNINDASEDELCRLGLITSLLGRLPTQKYTLAQLDMQRRKTIGAISFSVGCAPISGAANKARLFIKASMSVLQKNLNEAVDLITEILKNTRFDDTEAIHKLVLQYSEDMYQSIIESGNQFASMRTTRNFSAVALANEKLFGFDRHCFLKKLVASFEDESESLTKAAYRLANEVFVPCRLCVSETASEKHDELLRVPELLGTSVDCSVPKYFTPALDNTPTKEAIQIPSGVSYAALGSNLCRYGEEYSYSGALSVLSGILSYGYLWNEIRVRGGAYGCGFAASASGNLAFRTFRDPTPLRSLDVCRSTAGFIRDFVASDESVEKYIISNVSSSDPLRSAAQKGDTADIEYFSEISYEEKCKLRLERLNLKKEELLPLCRIFEKMAEDSGVCIVAPESVVSSLDKSWTVYKL